ENTGYNRLGVSARAEVATATASRRGRRVIQPRNAIPHWELQVTPNVSLGDTGGKELAAGGSSRFRVLGWAKQADTIALGVSACAEVATPAAPRRGRTALPHS